MAEKQGYRAVLGVWEQLNNPGFNSLEFEEIRNEAGRNSFFLSAKKWIEATGAIGLHARAGRYGGTYAHKDIAFEFGSWLSPEFKLYLIKEFQRLKDEESRAQALEWNFQRTLAKVNYKIHTDAIEKRLWSAAEEIRVIAREQNRWVKVVSCYPISPTVRNRRGIDKTDWFQIDRALYDSCTDPRDYRPKRT